MLPARRVAALGAVAFVVICFVAACTGVGGSTPGASVSPRQTTPLGIFAPVAGRILDGAEPGWAVDPSVPGDRARLLLTSEPGIPIGWSSDGTRLLILRGSGDEGRLFVLDADGAETQVTDRPSAIRGAAISPDGSRVAFTGRTGSEGPSALYVVDADGGPTEMLVESRFGIMDELTFSPDGTQIAYDDGRGDWGHSVWLVDSDGGDALQIVDNESTAGAGHVSGITWSPAGDRIALGVGVSIYTFAPDGSSFTRVIAQGLKPYWSPNGSQLAYTITCLQDSDGCRLGLADADGANVQDLGVGASGPWHPGTLVNGADE